METTTSRKRDRGNNHGTSTAYEQETVWDEAFFQRLVDPDFEELARQIPAFGVAWRRAVAETRPSPASTAAHMTPECSVALCQALLRVYFSIVLTHVPFLPSDDNDAGRTEEIHLCPPVPNRFFYVRWIQNELLPRGQDAAYFVTPSDAITHSNDTVRGLDIGTGAVAIYPLLMVASWTKAMHTRQRSIIMYATEIDERSVESARTNIHGNTQLRHQIHLWHVPASDRQCVAWASDTPTGMAIDEKVETSLDLTSDVLFPVGPLRRSIQHVAKNAPHPIQPLTFAMTNPPFYDLDEYATIQQGSQYHGRRHQHHEIQQGVTQAEQHLSTGRPHAAMTKFEGSYPGGEVGFGLDMIVDGLHLFLQHRQYHLDHSTSTPPPSPPVWTSTMCGKKSSLVQLHHVVTQLLGPAHVCRTEFGPSQLTRWFLAWTFQRPVARSPWARLPPWTFVVPFTALPIRHDNGDSALMVASECCREVASRIGEYGRALHWACDVGPVTVTPHTSLQTLQLREESITLPPWKDDQALPESLQRILVTMDPIVRVEFLPPEGHFILDIQIEVASGISVQVQPYQHSAHGRKVIEKVKSQLESEVCRTNRRWRRIQQREQQNLDQQTHAMDDTT